ncbi:hypothetical protein JCM5353_006228 [Sporobolomyces roseus]
MTSTTSPPSLLSHISSSLSSSFPGTHTFSLQAIRSAPRRSYALFPHASNHKTCKIFQEEVLCILNLERETTSKEGETANKGWVPLCAIEASIYTIPSTSTSLLYISKVDTTGLQLSSSTSSTPPSPTKSFVSSFLSYHLLYPPHFTTRLRIHVFARSQGQYLFPGSIDNTSTKKVLDDKGLLRWWKSTLSLATHQSTLLPERLESFYLVPGLSYLESLPYVPNPTPSNWKYGHPYSSLPSPLHSSPGTHDLTDHIPSFPDDPKSRFLHSLTSSSLSPSGSEGDYDDVHHQVTELKFVSGGNWTPAQRMQEVEKERERERKRLVDGVKGGVEEWWERMNFRQECCSGVLVGFFVVGLEPAQMEEKGKGKENGEEEVKHPDETKEPMSEEDEKQKIEWEKERERLIQGMRDDLKAMEASLHGLSTPQMKRAAEVLARAKKEIAELLDSYAQRPEPTLVTPSSSLTLPSQSQASLLPTDSTTLPPPSQPATSPSKSKSSHHSPPSPYPSSLPHATFTKLWTQFHNHDYSLASLSTLIPNLKKWESDVLSLVASEGEGRDEGEVRRVVEVKNEALVTLKREVPVEEVKKVNTLAPRKKKKVT